jgi:hypothetical protein
MRKATGMTAATMRMAGSKEGNPSLVSSAGELVGTDRRIEKAITRNTHSMHKPQTSKMALDRRNLGLRRFNIYLCYFIT